MRSSSGSWIVAVSLLAVLLHPGRALAVSSSLLGRPITAIEFISAAPIDVAGLTKLMPMRVGARLRAEDLEEARWRLIQKDIFTSVAIDVQPRGRGVAVIARLVRKSVINRVRFEGNRAISTRELQRTVLLRANMTLTEKLQRYAVRRIQELYVAQGFDGAHVTLEVRPRSPGEVDVVFVINEGLPLRIAAIDVKGVLPLPAEAVLKAAGLHVGDRYERDRVRNAEKAIVALLRDHRYYEVQVDTKWEPAAARTGTLRVTIDPGPLFTLSFSGNHRFSDARLLDLIDLPKRPIVTDGTWRALARRARHAYQEDGYYFAKVAVKIEEGPPKAVHFTIDEGRAYHIAAVRFQGNHGLSNAQLLAPMATRPPSWLPWRRGILIDSVLDDDLKRLWYLYREYGYESAQITDARTRFDHKTGEIFLSVFIDEGPQTIVRQVQYAGMAPIAKTLPPLAVRSGYPLNRNQVEQARQALITAFASAGYTKAKVKAEVTSKPSGRQQRAATVRFEAVAGARERVGVIIVRNNLETHAGVIVRELPFVQGDPLDPNKLLGGQTNIYKLGLFRSVTVRPMKAAAAQRLQNPSESAAVGLGGRPGSTRTVTGGTAAMQRRIETESSGRNAPKPSVGPEPEGASHRTPVTVTVFEKPAGNLQWGAGYNTRDGLRGFVEVSDDNLQGLARRLSLRGEFSLQPSTFTLNDYLGNLGFREPRLDGTKWAFRSNLIAQRSTRRVDQFSIERLALIPAIERYFLPGLQAGVDLQIEQARIFDLQPDVFAFNPRDDGDLRTVSLGPFVIYDDRDNSFAPHSGIFDSLRLRVAPTQLGSQIPFFKLTGQHAQYVPITDGLTFVYVARGGYAVPFNGGDIIPIRERFFLGGGTTVRGFAENSIGPTGGPTVDPYGQIVNPGGDPLGGDLAINLNTELRFPLLYGFGGVGFVDGGGVYLQDLSISIHNFRRSAGLGLRYMTPVGPLSLDYGFKLDRRTGESVGEVHFSVGTIF